MNIYKSGTATITFVELIAPTLEVSRNSSIPLYIFYNFRIIFKEKNTYNLD